MCGVRRTAVALSLLMVASAVTACAGEAGTLRIEILIHYSAFEPAEVSVPHGVPVTIVLINQDPIDHEFLIGDEAFHARHRDGTEAQHGTRPDEVTIEAMSVAQTTLVFDEPGALRYICHFPRHEAYGMVGTLHVT